MPKGKVKGKTGGEPFTPVRNNSHFSRQPSARAAESVSEDEDSEKLRQELEKEKKNGLEYKKRLNNEKIVIANLKNKIKSLEEDKSKLEEQHRKSFVGIEQKVSTLKNTNLQLLNKAHRFESINKELDEERGAKDATKDKLK